VGAAGSDGAGGSGAPDARDGAPADAPSDAPPDGSHDVAADADATKIVISGITDGAPIDLDPGAASDIVSAAGGTITRFAC
jgi:hypothetical protein